MATGGRKPVACSKMLIFSHLVNFGRKNFSSSLRRWQNGLGTAWPGREPEVKRPEQSISISPSRKTGSRGYKMKVGARVLPTHWFVKFSLVVAAQHTGPLNSLPAPADQLKVVQGNNISRRKAVCLLQSRRLSAQVVILSPSVPMRCHEVSP